MSNDWRRASFWRLPCAVAAGILFLLAVGCGGEGDSETAADTEPLSKPQFVKQANAVCERELKEKDEAVQKALSKAGETGQDSSRADLERIVSEVVLPGFEQTTKELRDLTPPVKEQEAVDDILQQFENALKETEEDPTKLLAANPFLAASEAAAAYGLTACNF
jgi:hypothetical protein